jgi:hypothetical protein
VAVAAIALHEEERAAVRLRTTLSVAIRTTVGPGILGRRVGQDRHPVELDVLPHPCPAGCAQYTARLPSTVAAFVIASASSTAGDRVAVVCHAADASLVEHEHVGFDNTS